MASATESHLVDARHSATTTTLASLLVEWQSTGNPHWLELLIARAFTLIESVARTTLRRHGIRDTSAIDDTVSIVLDHVRRLPGTSPSERSVSPFSAHPPAECLCELADSGRAYLVRLTLDRAIDVGRSRRRRERHLVSSSHLEGLLTGEMTSEKTDRSGEEEACTAMHLAIGSLEPNQREIIDMLLEDKTQAAIAIELGVCEGTVSRLRTRAIAALRHDCRLERRIAQPKTTVLRP
jgi:RNA polymerase sigma factor (sigma-70 family)